MYSTHNSTGSHIYNFVFQLLQIKQLLCRVPFSKFALFCLIRLHKYSMASALEKFLLKEFRLNDDFCPVSSIFIYINGMYRF